MRNLKNKKRLQIILFLLIIVVVLGVGYASISAINLIVNSNAIATTNQENFSVKFLDEDGARPSIEGSPTNKVNVTSDTVATFDITTLSRKSESVTATLKVKNSSNGIGALIGLNLTNSNPEFFKVTETILDNSLQAGEKTTVTVKVEMIKTPINNSVSASIKASLIATPIENTVSSGGDAKIEVNPDPYVYSITSNSINSKIKGTTYSNFYEAKLALENRPIIIAHILDGTMITESYIALEKNGKIYYLRGGARNEYEQPSTPIYDANKEVLKEAFPDWENYCLEEELREGGEYFNCNDGFFNINVMDGSVDINISDLRMSCSITGINSQCN